MADEDNDGIYEITLGKKTDQHTMEFKFVIENNQFELQDNNNWVINFQYRPQFIAYSASYDDPKGFQQTVNL